MLREGERQRLTTVRKTEPKADSVSSQLLERSLHLTALDDAFAAVLGTSRGQLEFVGGEAGVGKTTLLRRFCGQRQRSARVLWGTCDALFTPRPLGPLQDIAQQTQGKLQQLVDTAARPHDVTRTLMDELRRGRRPSLYLRTCTGRTRRHSTS